MALLQDLIQQIDDPALTPPRPDRVQSGRMRAKWTRTGMKERRNDT